MIIKEDLLQEKFNPIKFEITIETEEELFEMYYRLNACMLDDYFERNCSFKKNYMETNGVSELFKFINTKINTMNLGNKLLGE